MKVISVNDPILLRVALRVLRRGGVVAFPTETSYGLGGDWTNPKVHAKVRRIKQRPQGKPLSVIVASRSMAERYAMFSPGRNWEQIRTTICYNDANVKIVGAHAGVSVGPDGATHQALEDIAMTRVLPNLTVVVPCDYEEAKKVFGG